MTSDDKRRLAKVYQRMGAAQNAYHQHGRADPVLMNEYLILLRRLLDEATAEADHYADMFHKAEETIAFITAERDAAMAALRPFAIAADDLDEKTRDNSEIWELPAAMGIEAKDLRNAKAVLAAHSAATKPTEEASG